MSTVVRVKIGARSQKLSKTITKLHFLSENAPKKKTVLTIARIQTNRYKMLYATLAVMRTSATKGKDLRQPKNQEHLE